MQLSRSLHGVRYRTQHCSDTSENRFFTGVFVRCITGRQSRGMSQSLCYLIQPSPLVFGEEYTFNFMDGLANVSHMLLPFCNILRTDQSRRLLQQLFKKVSSEVYLVRTMHGTILQPHICMMPKMTKTRCTAIIAWITPHHRQCLKNKLRSLVNVRVHGYKLQPYTHMCDAFA